MAITVIMPRLGQSVESCIISKWHKKVGDPVKAGEVLFTYETDKATFDEEARADGTILAILFNEGDDVPVLANVCTIGEANETAETSPVFSSAASFDSTSKASVASVASSVTSDSSSVAPSNSGSLSSGYISEPSATAFAAGAVGDSSLNDKVRISPRARNLASTLGLDISAAKGSGPGGRIIEKDIRELAEKGPYILPSMPSMPLDADGKQYEAMTIGGRVLANAGASATGTQVEKDTASDTAAKEDKAKSAAAVNPATVPSIAPVVSAITKESYNDFSQRTFDESKLTGIRKAIAKAMLNSVSTTAQLTLNSSFDATEIMAFRKKLKESGNKAGLDGITLNDIILFAISRTLPKYKELNAHFLDDKMHLYNNIHLGIAVDTSRGLMVPVISFADKKSLLQISAEAKKLAQDCQNSIIGPDSLKGGSFTTTNLGTLGIESFTPVLNPPQTGILGICNITQRAREKSGGSGEIEFYPAMGLSLTFDHRAIDGAPAAKFLQELKQNLENFVLLLAKG